MMEKKLVIVPFDLELAKKITNGEVEGRIIDERSYHYRLVCFDLLDDKGEIIGLRKNNNYTETALTFNNNGYCVQHSKCILSLEIPEYMTFKDKDIITFGNDKDCLAIGIFRKKESDTSHECYVRLDYLGNLSFDINRLTYNNSRLATEEEKQKLIDALISSKYPKAKECLKMLGIEVKPECKFKPKDWVLCKSNDEWCLCRFSHKTIRFDGVIMYATVGGICYDNCIPYNEQTAHLLGTNKDWKE